MALRFYICSFLGSGTEVDPYRTPFVNAKIKMNAIDLRPFPEIQDGYAAVWGQISDADHTAIIANTAVIYLPFEDSGGTLLPLSSTISQVSGANISTIQAAFSMAGIPTSGITGAMTIGAALKIMQRRCYLSLVLRYVDFSSWSLSDTINSLPTQLLKAVKRRLTNSGFDISGLNGTTTIGDAINILSNQAIIDTNIANIPGLALQ